MTKKYLICSDIDGTLLRQDQTVSKKTRDLIQTLEKDGHIFSISTGRMYRSAREVGFQVSSSGHVIASNGSYAAIRDEQLLKTTLEEKAIRSTYDIMSDFDLPLFFFSTNTLFYTKEPPAFFQNLADKSRLDTGHNSFSLVSINEKGIFDENMHQFLNAIVVAEEDASKLTEVRAALNEANGIRVLSSHHNNLEILPANSDKKQPLKRLESITIFHAKELLLLVMAKMISACYNMLEPVLRWQMQAIMSKQQQIILLTRMKQMGFTNF